MKDKATLDEHGRELLDSTPVAIPLRLSRPSSMDEQVRAILRSEQLQAELDRAGEETFEEADDFRIEDDPIDPSTPYEDVFDPPLEETRTPPEGGAAPVSRPADPAPAAPAVEPAVPKA